VLVIGGGGYSLPKFLITHTKRMRVCVVEIDPEITDIARRRFFLDRAESLSGGRLELVCADGWKWLREEGRRFDVIINDAFKGSKPMGDLDTAEGARLIASRLTDRGVYLANIRCPLEGRRSRVLERTREVFDTEFKNVHVIAECNETPRSLGDNVLVATNRALGDSMGQKTAVGA
jgi:spermidine synthase